MGSYIRVTYSKCVQGVPFVNQVQYPPYPIQIMTSQTSKFKTHYHIFIVNEPLFETLDRRASIFMKPADFSCIFFENLGLALRAM